MKNLIIVLIVLITFAITPYAESEEVPDWYFEALEYILADKDDELLALYTRVINEMPETAPEAYYLRGGFYQTHGNYEQALKDKNKALELKPENATYYQGRADLYKDMGNFELALKDINKAIALAQGNKSHLYNTRAQIYDKFGEHQLAIEDYKTSARLGDKQIQKKLREQGIQW